jgi:hypothetical protein
MRHAIVAAAARFTRADGSYRRTTGSTRLEVVVENAATAYGSGITKRIFVR